MYIAELNIARMRYPLDDPRMDEFRRALDTVNLLADRSPGFVWRYTDESGNATDTHISDDPLWLVNMSVWKTAETLEAYVWQTLHKRVYNNKGRWLEPPKAPHFVMWPVALGVTPSLDEGLSRLEHIRTHGPSDHAFGWESLPHLKLWMAQRCG